LEDVFGREGLKDVLGKLAEANQKPAQVLRETLESSLGGPFRPVSITDRAIYRNWLTKEIARRTVELLGQDLDISEAGRAGGSRRKEISYDEAESLAGVADGELGADTQAFTSNQMRAAGEREDRERAAFRSTDQRTRQLQASEKKDRMERELAHRMDLQRSLDRIQREHEAPVLQQYIACVKEEPLLMHDDVAAARALGWTVARVSDVKRRLNLHIAKLAAEQRWKSLFPKGL